MARVKFHADSTADFLFRWTKKPVKITGVTFTKTDEGWFGGGILTFEIEGDDVPNVPEVQAMITVEGNRAGELLHVMRFDPVAAVKAA